MDSKILKNFQILDTYDEITQSVTELSKILSKIANAIRSWVKTSLYIEDRKKHIMDKLLKIKPNNPTIHFKTLFLHIKNKSWIFLMTNLGIIIRFWLKVDFRLKLKPK